MLRQALQIAVAVFFCTVWRLVPFRPPNVQPVLATSMPFGKREGALSAALFSALTMIMFDVLTSGITQWTVVTALSFALVSAGSAYFLRWVKGIPGYVLYAIIGTLVYDALTGVVAGAVLFGMGWRDGFIGQIPFTINHLIGNVILAVVLSPAVEWLLAWSDSLFTAPISKKKRVRA